MEEPWAWSSWGKEEDSKKDLIRAIKRIRYDEGSTSSASPPSFNRVYVASLQDEYETSPPPFLPFPSATLSPSPKSVSPVTPSSLANSKPIDPRLARRTAASATSAPAPTASSNASTATTTMENPRRTKKPAALTMTATTPSAVEPKASAHVSTGANAGRLVGVKLGQASSIGSSSSKAVAATSAPEPSTSCPSKQAPPNDSSGGDIPHQLIPGTPLRPPTGHTSLLLCRADYPGSIEGDTTRRVVSFVHSSSFSVDSTNPTAGTKETSKALKTHCQRLYTTEVSIAHYEIASSFGVPCSQVTLTQVPRLGVFPLSQQPPFDAQGRLLSGVQLQVQHQAPTWCEKMTELRVLVKVAVKVNDGEWTALKRWDVKASSGDHKKPPLGQQTRAVTKIWKQACKTSGTTRSDAQLDKPVAFASAAPPPPPRSPTEMHSITYGGQSATPFSLPPRSITSLPPRPVTSLPPQSTISPLPPTPISSSLPPSRHSLLASARRTVALPTASLPYRSRLPTAGFFSDSEPLLPPYAMTFPPAPTAQHSHAPVAAPNPTTSAAKAAPSGATYAWLSPSHLTAITKQYVDQGCGRSSFDVPADCKPAATESPADRRQRLLRIQAFEMAKCLQLGRKGKAVVGHVPTGNMLHLFTLPLPTLAPQSEGTSQSHVWSVDDTLAPAQLPLKRSHDKVDDGPSSSETLQALPSSASTPLAASGDSSDQLNTAEATHEFRSELEDGEVECDDEGAAMEVDQMIPRPGFADSDQSRELCGHFLQTFFHLAAVDPDQATQLYASHAIMSISFNRASPMPSSRTFAPPNVACTTPSGRRAALSLPEMQVVDPSSDEFDFDCFELELPRERQPWCEARLLLCCHDGSRMYRVFLLDWLKNDGSLQGTVYPYQIVSDQVVIRK